MNIPDNIDKLLPSHLVIGGELVPAASGGEFDHINPSTGRRQRTVPLGGPGEIDRAVEAARTALGAWRQWEPKARRRVLLRFAELMRANADDLATIMVLEAGVTSMVSPWIVNIGIDYIEDAAGWADKLYGDTLPVSAGVFNYTSPEPYGVVGALTTWNGSIGGFPMSVAGALAAGCTVVVKPSELAPFGPIRLAELAMEAGIPAGVVNVVPGTTDAGAALVSHPGVDKITFTGSPPTRRRIAAACAESLTPCVFELGGKSASIIFDDADLETAIATAANVIIASGQQCTLGSRLIVHRDIHEQFAEGLARALDSIAVGDPFEASTMMGPVINEAGCDRIMGLIDRARAYGNVRAGGNRLGGDLADGYFVSPTLIEGVDNGSEIATTEVFGPVLVTIPFTDEDEAIAIANDTPYGLAGYVSTRDLARAHRVASRLDAGNIGINGGFAPAGPSLPFGGRKASGNGKQGGLGGVMEFVSMKTVQVGLN